MRAQRRVVGLALCNSQLHFDLHGLSTADRLPPPTEAQKNQSFRYDTRRTCLHCMNAVGGETLEGGR